LPAWSCIHALLSRRRENFFAASFQRMSRRNLLALLITVPALLGLSACGKRETPAEAGIRTRTLHVGNGVEPQGLDPHTTTGANDAEVQLALFEPLLSHDPVTGLPAPGAAASWEISADLLTYTFKLRPEGRWSDGRPVVAEDFVRTVQRGLSPKLAAEIANDHIWIAGGRAHFEGKERDFSRVGVRALDSLTLQFTLADPMPAFLPVVAGRAGMPLPIDAIIKHGGLEQRGAPWTRPGNRSAMVRSC
jgi:oligopeptide transport system substrate-binding protein